MQVGKHKSYYDEDLAASAGQKDEDENNVYLEDKN